MRKMIFLAAFAAATVAVPGAAQAQRLPDAVVAVVDTTKVYGECTACVAAEAYLRGQLTTLQAREQTLNTQLQPERDALQKEVLALEGKEPSAALTQRIQAFQQRAQQASQELATAQRRLQSIRAHVASQLEQRVDPIINQVMVARGANLAVPIGASLAHAQSLNVTNDVLARLNQAFPAASLTPLPQPAQPAQPQQQQPTGR